MAEQGRATAVCCPSGRPIDGAEELRRFQRDDETLMRTVDDLKGTHAAVNREHAARKRTVDALQKTVNELKRKT